jgi:hypothetical protein
VAEYHLGRFLENMKGVRQVEQIDADGQPDFRVTFDDGRSILVECKNTLRQKRPPQVDFQKTRASKSDPCSRFYKPSQFDVLAACLHPITERWEFRFCRTSSLDEHKTCKGRLSPKVVVDGPRWTADLRFLLD